MLLVNVDIPRKRRRLKTLCGVFIAEIFLIILFVAITKNRLAYGFVFKNGRSFSVAWNAEGNDYRFTEHSTLLSAMKFANNDLNLKLGQNPVVGFQLEHAWKSSRFGREIVFWKTLGYPFLHQLTFTSSLDAVSFLKALQQGAYTPSPFGNALLLVPKD